MHRTVQIRRAICSKNELRDGWFGTDCTYLVKSLVVPMSIHQLELRRHPIVLPHPQGVHNSELRLLITANIS